MIDIASLAKTVKAAARHLALTSTEERNAALSAIADAVLANAGAILTANGEDIAAAKAKGLSEALIDRLLLNEKRLQTMAADVLHVVELPDPVGEIFEQGTLPNGMRYRKQRVPMGVLGVIYEARPNVTLDVAALALKSGNGAILRGGSETIHSNRALAGAIRTGLEASALPSDSVRLIEDTDRALVQELLQQDDHIDMIIPRGGSALHEFCRKNSRIPVITGGIGICHLFVDESADLTASVEVVRNAKIQRPSVCNALDTVLVHRAVAETFIPLMVRRLAADGVTFRAAPEAFGCAEAAGGGVVRPAGERDFDTEWLSLVLGIRVVGGLDEAVAHIATHSTGHSDGILTADAAHAAQFVRVVDSAVVYVNASTRFTDGAQLGLGAEVAVSTQRMQARGPMGLRELMTFKWVLEGDYHVRPS